MRGILINPWLKEIKQVEVGNDIQDIYQHLSNTDPSCLVTCITIGHVWENGDTLYVDDEGLFKPQCYFKVLGGNLLTGRGLILGTNFEGDSVDVKSDLTDIIVQTTFLSSIKGTSRWT